MRALVVSLVAMGLAVTLSAQGRRSVLIRSPKPYDALAAAIEREGGTVTHRFKHVDGIAADLPESAVTRIERLVGANNIGRDDIIPLPEVSDPKGGIIEARAEAESSIPVDTIGADGQVPSNYTFNNLHTNVQPLHDAAFIGAGIVIAIIDSGYRPIMQHVAPSRVLPGLNLVPGDPEAVSNANQSHGTFVAGMAAAARLFCFSALNKFVPVAEHYGAATEDPRCPAGTRLIPMIGAAPGATIFPIKVFPAAGGGTPTSRTIAAMEAAIDLRKKYDQGMPDGLNIRVVNLSLGGPTSAAARTLSDLAVEKVINADIVPAIAAGNDGMSTVTGGSPGTSFAALTVGSASGAEHERIFRAQFSAPCGLPTVPLSQALACALAWRPDDTVQISEFSSRGPTHDGRIDPDIVAYGSNNFSQGSGTSSGTVNFGSGTSFATPTVSGIAAVLRQAVPGATARQIRNALIMTADPARVPTATPNDQGAGFVNAAAALALLQTGTVPDSYATAGFTRELTANMSRAGRVVYDTAVSIPFTNIRPAELAEVALRVPDNALSLNVRVHSITAELPEGEQNQFFGDDVFMRIQSSAVHRRDRRAEVFIPAGASPTFTFARPDAGVWRITPSADWTNAGRVSFTVDAWVEQEPWPQHTANASIGFGDIHTIRFDVAAGTSRLDARLSWMNMNGNYPISDIDVILTPPSGAVINTCNTIRAPELCSVDDPVPGTWTASVVGFSVPTFGTPGGTETYTLRIAADGLVLPAK